MNWESHEGDVGSLETFEIQNSLLVVDNFAKRRESSTSWRSSKGSHSLFLGVKVWKDKASKPGTNKQCHPSLVIVVPSIDRRPLTTLWCLFGPSTTSTSSALTISTWTSTTGTATTTHWQPFGVWRTKRLSLPDNRHLSPATNLCSTSSELNNRILNIYL